MKSEKAKNIIQETRKAYNTIYDHFSQTRQNLWSEFEDFKSYFQTNDKVLDFGCGNGRFYELIKEFNPDYYGVDLSDELLLLAKQKIPEGHFVLIDENLTLPFKDNFFDKIVCLATFHHIPSQELEEKVLKEFYRVLKPNGILILTVWDFYHGKNKKYLFRNYFSGIINFIFRSKSFLGFKDFYVPWKDNQGQVIAERYFHAFTLKELNSLLKKVGYKVLSSQIKPHNNKKEYYNLIIIAQK